MAVVDLEGRVVDPEALVQLVLELQPDRVAVGVLVDGDVGRERREAGRDLPDVQVVDLVDARVTPPSRGRSRPGRGPAGAASRKTRPGLPQQPVGGVEHDRGDDQRGDSVGLVEAGE